MENALKSTYSTCLNYDSLLVQNSDKENFKTPVRKISNTRSKLEQKKKK
ncbi:hypothetical protein Gotur_006396 [Gossypium turneri]